MWFLWELRYALQMQSLWELAFWMWILWELSIANVNFRKAEHLQCNFFASWAFQMCILWQLSFMKVNFLIVGLSIANENLMRTELCECLFYRSWALWMWNYERWALHVCIYKSWALQMWIFWELSFGNVSILRVELCIANVNLFVFWQIKSYYYFFNESYALQWELSFVNVFF